MTTKRPQKQKQLQSGHNDTKPNTTGYEIERRYLVESIDLKILEGAEKIDIVQGYDPSCKIADHTRVRIINGKKAILTCKTSIGKGNLTRKEQEASLSVKAARMLLDTQCPFILKKTRYRLLNREHIVVDIFTEPFPMILVEIELKKETDRIRMPKAFKNPIEVTDILTNFTLAVISTHFANIPYSHFVDMITTKIPTIAFTGGPCSGKSTALKELKALYSKKIMTVNETATILIKDAGITPPENINDPMGTVFQKTVYKAQEAIEFAIRFQAAYKKKKLIIADRGTRDGRAYCASEEEFNGICHTTAEKEFHRYEAVFCLELPSREVYVDRCKNNPARLETYDQALERQKNTIAAWQGHPNFYFIPDKPTWDEKFNELHEKIKNFL